MSSFTRKTDIYMSTHILHVMSLMPIKAYPFFDTQFAEEILDMAGVADERKPRDFDLISAQMRTAYMFAATMVHEFAHAFCKAYFERPDTKPAQPNEPWLADNRNNELGHAVILQILGGNTRIEYSLSYTNEFCGGYQAVELCAIRHSFPRTMGYVGQDQQIPTSDFRGCG